MKCYLTIIFVLVFAASGSAQRSKPGSVEELSAITERGRSLYAYDEAAWHGTDAVLALKPPKGSFESYIAQKTGDRWTVVFGKLNENRTAYLIAYEAIQSSSPKEFVAKHYDQLKQDKDFYLSSALAIDIAKADFGKVNRPYNVAVLPASGGQLYLYLVPAQTVGNVFPLGGDVRYLFSKDGGKILERRRMHKTVLEFEVPKDSTPETGFHIAIMDDIPEDSDVFHVLTRGLAIPEMIVTNNYVYQVKADGSIMYIMTKEAFLKIPKGRQLVPE